MLPPGGKTENEGDRKTKTINANTVHKFCVCHQSFDVCQLCWSVWQVTGSERGEGKRLQTLLGGSKGEWQEEIPPDIILPDSFPREMTGKCIVQLDPCPTFYELNSEVMEPTS